MTDGTDRRSKPLLAWDGDCRFCRTQVARLQAVTGDRVDYATAQDVAPRHPEIPAEWFRESVVLLMPDGTVARGAEAVLRVRALGGRRVGLALYRRVPGAAPVAEAAYRAIARHRVGASRLDALLWGRGHVRSEYVVSSWLFIRLLAVVYLAAFASLWVQVHGLVGSGGILPVAPFLDAVHERFGAPAWSVAPTLCWLDPSDRFLDILCGGGVVLSILLLLGAAPVPILLALWAAYLSLNVVCRDFLTFQWDALLLETGLLSVFLVPLAAWTSPRKWPEPRRLVRWLAWWLLFRLMFLSGLVKILSGDPTWRDLTALEYHHFTQPLPATAAWWLDKAPSWLQQASVVSMFVIELALPFFIVLTRRLRMLAAVGFLGLQAFIAGSGNYGFFNVLSAALCLLLIDDEAWPGWLRRGFVASPSRHRVARWSLAVVVPFAALALLVTTVRGLGRLDVPVAWPAPVERLVRAVGPFDSFNAYGLFAVMTTTRPEIVIEGSNDGRRWEPLEFRYKVGDPSRAPRYLGLHMPRLDWRMWFAALGRWQSPSNGWLRATCSALLRGEPDVMGLLERNPFPLAPPRYLRLMLYQYRFSDAATRRATGQWWVRDLVGPYSPVLSAGEP